MKPVSIVIALLLGPLAAAGALAGPNQIVAEHAWARATPKLATNAAAYITLSNHGKTDDRLLMAASPAAASIQFHAESGEAGVMKMTQLSTVALPAGGTVVFSPGGLHMMMVGLDKQLKDGETVPLILTFEKAGVIELPARVGKVGAMSDPAAGQANGN